MDVNRKRILVIDDTQALAEDIARALEPRYETRIASGGTAGVEAALSWEPDIILLDLQMPDLDGFGVLGELRKHGIGARVITMSSKYERAEDVMCAIDLGAATHIDKNTYKELLPLIADKIRTVLDKTTHEGATAKVGALLERIDELTRENARLRRNITSLMNKRDS